MTNVIKDGDMLRVKFNYDANKVKKIKTIVGKRYDAPNKEWLIPLESIHMLKELFDDLIIDENVDQEYKFIKYDFKEEVDSIKNSNLKSFAQWSLTQLPDYFYKVAASSTGKYHPKYALGEGGLVRHTRAAFKMANELFENHSIQKFNDDEKDIIRVAILLHDGLKHGINNSPFTIAKHPLKVAEFIESKIDELEEEIIDREIWDIISNCIKSHMGEWNTDYKTKQEILPTPKTKLQKFVHLCDYLASRKCIEIVL